MFTHPKCRAVDSASSVALELISHLVGEGCCLAKKIGTV